MVLDRASEGQGFAPRGVVDVPVVVGKMTIDEGLLDAPGEGVSFQRTPATLAEDVCLMQSPRFGADQYEVGLITRAQETALLDAEEEGWLMAHGIDHAFEREHAFVHQSEHTYE